MESTAGAYLGKYLSAAFGSLLDATESFKEADRDGFADKAATWKLALYWATNRRFWSCSESITRGIRPNEHTDDPDVRETVRRCSLDSLRAACESDIPDIVVWSARTQSSVIQIILEFIERNFLLFGDG
jgi:hypothetical protein